MMRADFTRERLGIAYDAVRLMGVTDRAQLLALAGAAIFVAAMQEPDEAARAVWNALPFEQREARTFRDLAEAIHLAQYAAPIFFDVRQGKPPSVPTRVRAEYDGERVTTTPDPENA